ncbi:MAG TPA: rhodanese-like domain-containing protein [Patescibacteria group bacterium]|jgi:rhodanese-related sulfurtransferase|nr:rhodanese-like domain-containing protein [Patescibacteria group bacterium]
MKLILSILVIAAIIGGGVYLSKQKAADGTVATTKLASDTVVYDVRTPDEYKAGHGENAINLPLDMIRNGDYPQVAKTTPIALYCRSGSRSSEAAAILQRAGYTNVKDIGAYANLKTLGIQTVYE